MSRKKVAHLTQKAPFVKARRLSAGAPDVLEVAVTLSEAVHAVVGLAHGANEAAEGVGLGLASESAVLVDLGDADLNRAVVLGLDDAVGGAALAGDVTARFEICQPFVCPCLPLLWCLFLWLSGGGRARSARREGENHGIMGESYRSTSSPRSFSMVTVL